ALEGVLDRLAPFDACFYCAGAPPVGTPQGRYRHVTFDLTLHVARAFAERNPRARLLYVSGAHADPGSRIMPLRIKGETEVALQALPLTTVMLRPAGIRPAHGERSPHRWMRPFYAVAAPLTGAGPRLAPGRLTRTAHLGRAMLAPPAMPSPPRVVQNDATNRLAAAPGTRGHAVRAPGGGDRRDHPPGRGAGQRLTRSLHGPDGRRPSAHVATTAAAAWSSLPATSNAPWRRATYRRRSGPSTTSCGNRSNRWKAPPTARRRSAPTCSPRSRPTCCRTPSGRRPSSTRCSPSAPTATGSRPTPRRWRNIAPSRRRCCPTCTRPSSARRSSPDGSRCSAR